MPEIKHFLVRFGGYYLVPHELLHVLAYRILDKPYHYQLGDYQVRSLKNRNRRERLFISLFPFTVCWAGGTISFFLWILSALFIQIPPERYFIEGPTWHIIFLIIGSLLILYSGTAHGDLINSYHLLFSQDKPKHNSPKPH